MLGGEWRQGRLRPSWRGGFRLGKPPRNPAKNQARQTLRATDVWAQDRRKELRIEERKKPTQGRKRKEQEKKEEKRYRSPIGTGFLEI